MNGKETEKERKNTDNMFLFNFPWVYRVFLQCFTQVNQ